MNSFTEMVEKLGGAAVVADDWNATVSAKYGLINPATLRTWMTRGAPPPHMRTVVLTYFADRGVLPRGGELSEHILQAARLVTAVRSARIRMARVRQDRDAGAATVRPIA